MNLNDTESRVLAILLTGHDGYVGVYLYFTFAGISEPLKLDRKVVRRACRSLKRKGLAEFGKGLWSDGQPAGAGYCATRAGAEWLREKAGLQPAGPYKSPQQELFP